MKFDIMHPPYTLLFLFRVAGPGLVVLAVPSEFWAQLVPYLEVPEIVLVRVAPLFGSLGIAAYEAYKLMEAGKTAPGNAAYWPLRVFVAWVVGAFAYGIVAMMFNGSSVMAAFLAGAGGDIILEKIRKKMRDKKDIGNDTTTD